MSNYIKYLVALIVVSLLAYGAQALTLLGMEAHHYWSASGYSLFGMYFFGFASSCIVCLLILLTYWSMPKSLGFVFLGLMTVKIVASYIYIKNGLGKFENDFLEYNFLVVFFLYLFFDVYIAFQSLNQADTRR